MRDDFSTSPVFKGDIAESEQEEKERIRNEQAERVRQERMKQEEDVMNPLVREHIFRPVRTGSWEQDEAVLSARIEELRKKHIEGAKAGNVGKIRFLGDHGFFDFLEGAVHAEYAKNSNDLFIAQNIEQIEHGGREDFFRIFELSKTREFIVNEENTAAAAFKDMLKKPEWAAKLVDYTQGAIMMNDIQYRQAQRIEDEGQREAAMIKANKLLLDAMKDTRKGMAAEYAVMWAFRETARLAKIDHLLAVEHGQPRDDLERKVDIILRVGRPQYNFQIFLYDSDNFTEEENNRKIEAKKKALVGSDVKLIIVDKKKIDKFLGVVTGKHLGSVKTATKTMVNDFLEQAGIQQINDFLREHNIIKKKEAGEQRGAKEIKKELLELLIKLSGKQKEALLRSDALGKQFIAEDAAGTSSLAEGLVAFRKYVAATKDADQLDDILDKIKQAVTPA